MNLWLPPVLFWPKGTHGGLIQNHGQCSSRVICFHVIIRSEQDIHFTSVVERNRSLVLQGATGTPVILLRSKEKDTELGRAGDMPPVHTLKVCRRTIHHSPDLLFDLCTLKCSCISGRESLSQETFFQFVGLGLQVHWWDCVHQEARLIIFSLCCVLI